MSEKRHIEARQLAQEAGESCACLMVRQAARRITRAYDEALRPVGLKGTQFTMLAAIVSAHGQISLGEVADRLDMERSTFSRNLNPLLRRGLVRHVDTMAGRRRAVVATDLGRETFLAAEPGWRRAQADVRQALAQDDMVPLLARLRSIGTPA